MKGRVVKERERIEALNAMSSQFLELNNCFNKESKGYAMMESLTASIIQCFKERCPLSEDLLHIAWKWNDEILIGKGGAMESSLWKCIYETLTNVLSLPLNKRDYIWFKLYVFRVGV